jgi:hypothetical protein
MCVYVFVWKGDPRWLGEKEGKKRCTWRWYSSHAASRSQFCMRMAPVARPKMMSFATSHSVLNNLSDNVCVPVTHRYTRQSE